MMPNLWSVTETLREAAAHGPVDGNVEAIESDLALCDEVNPIRAPGQWIPLSDPARSARLLQTLTLQVPRHGTLR